MTRKFFALLLAMVVFQFCWTAISVYCSHESGRAAQHFGHHPHSEDGDELLDKAKDTQPSSAKKMVPHAHCSSCYHASLAPASIDHIVLHPLEIRSGPSVQITPLTSADTPPPERPQWTTAV